VTFSVKCTSSAEPRQVQVAVDAADLVAGFEHPGGTSAQRHLPIPVALDVPGVLPADLDHRFDGVAERSVRAKGGGTPSRRMARVHVDVPEDANQ
jgi:hypothetical protein